MNGVLIITLGVALMGGFVLRVIQSDIQQVKKNLM